MKIEYIIKEDAFKNYLKEKIEENGDKISITYNNAEKETNNYLLTLFVEKKSINNAKVLSKEGSDISNILEQNNVKFYTLINETSLFFTDKLYPLVSKFETKLRKLLYLALFDLDKNLRDFVDAWFSKKFGKKNKKPDIDNNNMLTKWSLGDCFDFLFNNNDFIDNSKNLISTIKDKKITKTELIDKLQTLEEKTIWNAIFAKEFSDFKLNNYHSNIFKIRNDVMHFHTIDYDNYIKGNTLLETANTELENQIKKNVILKSNNYNIKILSKSATYFGTLFDIKSLDSESLQNMKSMDFESLQNMKSMDFESLQNMKSMDFEPLQNMKSMDFESLQNMKSMDFELPQHMKSIDFSKAIVDKDIINNLTYKIPEELRFDRYKLLTSNLSILTEDFSDFIVNAIDYNKNIGLESGKYENIEMPSNIITNNNNKDKNKDN